ncbi:hypothetical protein [Nocardia camponoti]|uniref:Uncharacterized protein n=1 Tax=Nocardia camponoti TaxID=1616106 RepID=A0A917VDB7_9NOCA|nr:hypothetical protein [Nocardia camponoti]GGK66386.1 hypothetical protein GCM10011591_43150 [Nocardia camponoti]
MVVSRMWRRFFGERTEALDPDRTDLVIVVSSFDDVESCSSVLDRSDELDRDAPALLRHHLRLPAAQTDAAVEIAGYDGYTRGASTDDGLILQRVQVLDPLSCSQERSRMAGLAARHDGTALGWDAMQPPRGAH